MGFWCWPLDVTTINTPIHFEFTFFRCFIEAGELKGTARTKTRWVQNEHGNQGPGKVDAEPLGYWIADLEFHCTCKGSYLNFVQAIKIQGRVQLDLSHTYQNLFPQYLSKTDVELVIFLYVHSKFGYIHIWICNWSHWKNNSYYQLPIRFVSCSRSQHRTSFLWTIINKSTLSW